MGRILNNPNYSQTLISFKQGNNSKTKLNHIEVSNLILNIIKTRLVEYNP